MLPQSYAKEFPHFSDKVHHPDNLYLSCRSCNISFSDSFPYKELKDRIRDENGTIGDWIRLQKIKDWVIFIWMEIGVDSFAAVDIEKGPPSAVERVNAVEQLIERIVFADNVGLD